MSNSAKEKLVVIIVPAVLIMLVLLAAFLYSRIYAPGRDGNNQDVNFNQNKNVVVLQNANSSTTESLVVPKDIDLEDFLPEVPPTTKTLGVTDTKQKDQRNITVRYEINRDYSSVKNMVSEHYKNKGWSLVNDKTDIFDYIKGDDKATAYLQPLDNDKILLTLAVQVID